MYTSNFYGKLRKNLLWYMFFFIKYLWVCVRAQFEKENESYNKNENKQKLRISL